MTGAWEARVLQLVYRNTYEQDLEFVSLINEALDKCDLETCKILMKTFVTDDDFGVQESVVSVLSSAKIEDYQRALLEELPRMSIDAPEWSDALIERELKFHNSKFREIMASVSSDAQESLQRLLQRDSFRNEYGDLTIGK